MGESDEGELAISVSGGWVRLVESQNIAGQDPQVTFAPIQVQIDYQLVVGGDVVEGIVFRRPGDGGNEYVCPPRDRLAQIQLTFPSKFPTCSSQPLLTTLQESGRRALTVCLKDVLGNLSLLCPGIWKEASRLMAKRGIP